jgi:amidase
MADLSLTRKPARELARLVRERVVSPVEVLDAHLAAIEKLNPHLNAIVTIAADQAHDAARRAKAAVTKGEPLGPLHGLPVAIKDITPTAGIRTTYASPIYKWGAGSRLCSPSYSACPTLRFLAPAPILTTRCSGRHAIRGIRA